jgi:hypothetical protein
MVSSKFALQDEERVYDGATGADQGHVHLERVEYSKPTK